MHERWMLRMPRNCGCGKHLWTTGKKSWPPGVLPLDYTKKKCLQDSRRGFRGRSFIEISRVGEWYQDEVPQIQYLPSVSELKWLKKNLKENEVILSIDFSKNYDNKQRHEVQSAHSDILKSLHWPERQQVNEEQPDSESGTEEDHTVDELVRKLYQFYIVQIQSLSKQMVNGKPSKYDSWYFPSNFYFLFFHFFNYREQTMLWVQPMMNQFNLKILKKVIGFKCLTKKKNFWEKFSKSKLMKFKCVALRNLSTFGNHRSLSGKKTPYFTDLCIPLVSSPNLFRRGGNGYGHIRWYLFYLFTVFIEEKSILEKLYFFPSVTLSFRDNDC